MTVTTEPRGPLLAGGRGRRRKEAKTCWEERGWGASPREVLGTPADLSTDVARAVPLEPWGLRLTQCPLPLFGDHIFPARSRMPCETQFSQWAGKSGFIHAESLTEV